ncbi:MAG: 30S ribosomal protein S2 [Parcubacteria group bacterium GW2011_GWC2_39_14]|nr:MAG: 30S ribosomal protein S2 [Parcubacteria group bacterium GW2011_GWC2_39_14]KKR55138.1 MAG: 30S ribosomal protein S2 [Parcubacteria group bacterium GW2011_GWA2_40_23]
MANVPSLQDLMKAGVHFGHQKSKWYPKMKPYIFIEKNGIHIINLEETQKALEKALNFITETVAGGGTVLFVGTKKQARDIVKDAALSCNMPYVTNRWLGGTLTNAPTVLGLVKKFRKLKEEKASGKLEKYTKKEQLEIAREIERLETIVGGIEKLERIPDILFMVDIKTDKTAVKEATRRHVPVVALCDTNSNPELVKYPIPSNDDAVKALQLMATLVAETIKEVKEKV